MNFSYDDWKEERQAEKDLVAKKKKEAKAAIAELTGEVEPVEEVPKTEKPIAQEKAEVNAEVPPPPTPNVPEVPRPPQPPPVVAAPRVERPMIVEKIEAPAPPQQPPQQQPQAPRQVFSPSVANVDDAEVCPACGRVVGSRDARCSHCGKYLTRACSRCGRAITSKHVFCTNCGYRLQR